MFCGIAPLVTSCSHSSHFEARKKGDSGESLLNESTLGKVSVAVTGTASGWAGSDKASSKRFIKSSFLPV